MAKKETKKVTEKMIKGDLDIQESLNEIIGEVEKPSKELIKKLKDTQLCQSEMRFLVDSFYQTQDKRIAIAAQIRSIEQEADNALDHELLSWSYNNIVSLEKGYYNILNSAANSSRVGRWLLQVQGIGPTLAAALLAYFDISKATSAGHFLSYAGLNDNKCPRIGKDKAKGIVNKAIENNDGVLDDSVVYKISKATGRKLSYLLKKSTNAKGKIIKEDLIKAISYMPYNKDLKIICWKVGHQFAFLQNKENSLYGRILRERKAYETAKNEAGEYANQAKEILANGDYTYIQPEDTEVEDYDFYKDCNSYLKKKAYGKTTEAYKALSQGKLPQAQIMARAERYATKLFISHLFEMMYTDFYHKAPPVPYTIAHQGHVDYIGPEVPYDFDK